MLGFEQNWPSAGMPRRKSFVPSFLRYWAAKGLGGLQFKNAPSRWSVMLPDGATESRCRSLNCEHPHLFRRVPPPSSFRSAWIGHGLVIGPSPERTGIVGVAHEPKTKHVCPWSSPAPHAPSRLVGIRLVSFAPGRGARASRRRENVSHRRLMRPRYARAIRRYVGSADVCGEAHMCSSAAHLQPSSAGYCAGVACSCSHQTIPPRTCVTWPTLLMS
jgi:hypothetical protein